MLGERLEEPVLSFDYSERTTTQAKTSDSKLYKFRKYFGIGLGIFSYIFVYFHRFSTAALSKLIAVDFKVPEPQLGIFTSFYFWPYGLIQPFVGALADVLEPGYMIGFANLLAGLGTLLISFTTDLNLACFGRLVVGIGCGIIFVPTNKVGANWLSINQYKMFSGIMMGFGGLGSILSQLPLSLIGGAIGWRPTFRIFAIIGCVLSILSFIFIRGDPAHYGYPSLTKKAEKESFKTIFKTLFSNILKVIKMGDFWVMAMYMSFSPAIFTNVSAKYGTSWLVDVFGYSQSKASTIQMALSISLIVGSPGIPWIAQKVGERKLTIIVATALALVAELILTIGDPVLSTIWIMILYFIFGCGGSSTQGIILAMAKEYVEPQLAATIVGLTNTGCFLGGGLSLTLTSVIFDTYGKLDVYPADAYRAGIWGIGIGYMVVSLVAAFLLRDPKLTDDMYTNIE